MEFVLNKKRPKTHKAASFLKGLQEEGVDINRGADTSQDPFLFMDAAPIWNGFQELSSSRQSGFSIGYIPHIQITDWLSENDIISLESRKHYRKFITFIDGLWVAHANDKKEPKKSSGIRK